MPTISLPGYPVQFAVMLLLMPLLPFEAATSASDAATSASDVATSARAVATSAG